jgi:hypothetical protein
MDASHRTADRVNRTAMRPTVVLTVLAAALGGGLVGAWIGSQRVDTLQGEFETTRRPLRDAGSSFCRSTPIREMSAPPAIGDHLGRDSTRALRDPVYLRRLMASYASEADLDRRGALLAVLQSAANDEVLHFALQLAERPDPASRQDGLQLLQAFPLDRTPVRELLVRQLGAERDPAMLRQLVDMLTPAVVPIEDAAPVVAQLARLRGHPDPDVRASSVLQSAQWDRQADLEDLLHRAVLDPAPQVREAAIAGVTAVHVRSDRLKDALLAIAGDPLSQAGERSAALFALQEFPLDRSEYAIYRQAATEAGPGEDQEDQAH